MASGASPSVAIRRRSIGIGICPRIVERPRIGEGPERRAEWIRVIWRVIARKGAPPERIIVRARIIPGRAVDSEAG
jgi:hypothetical protein